MTSSFEVLPPRPAGGGLGGIVSLLLHLAFLAPFFVRRPSSEERHDPIDRLVVFLVPPDRPGGAGTEGAAAHWSDAPGTEGTTPAPPPRFEAADAPLPGDPGDPAPSDSVIIGRILATETALSEIEVDSVVERDPTSAAPRYPEDLLAKRIEGSTFVHYVVDTTGRVDTLTIRIVKTSAPQFAVAVRDALAQMKFRPAVQSSRKVRQWVEQNFAFKILKPVPADTT